MATTRDNKAAFLRLLDSLWPGLARAFVQAITTVRNRVALTLLEQAIRSRDVHAAFEALRFDKDALFELDEAIEGTFRQGGKYQVEALIAASKRAPRGAMVVASFGGRNPRAERIARDLGGRLIAEIAEDTQRLAAEAVRSGLEVGRNPRAVALDLIGRIDGNTRRGGLVGLHSTQARYVQAMREDLADPKRMSRYFTRERRDRRFDSTVRKAMEAGHPLAQADIDRITGRYADRLLKTRGEAIARTEALKALNAGRHEGLAQMIERGDVAADAVTLRWDDTGDGRTRDSHRAADGQEVKFGEPFIVGGHELMFPGDTSRGAPARETVNCRCYLSPRIDFYKGLR